MRIHYQPCGGGVPLLGHGRIARSILACIAIALHASCTTANEPRALPRAATDEASSQGAAIQIARPRDAPAVTWAQVHEIQIARWKVWEELAAGLPDDHLLSIELLHSKPDVVVSVLTFVRQQHALQSVVGLPAASDTAPLAASPEGVALGEPPPKEPPQPGLIALSGSLQALAFSQLLSAPPATSSEPDHDVCCSPDDVRAAMSARSNEFRATAGSIVMEEQVAAVRTARWQAWRQLARTLPDGHVLSAELLHSAVDERVAVLTVVKGGEPVQYVVADDRHALSSVRSAPPAAANTVAFGEPPVKEPPHPGVVAVGISLLAAAFDAPPPASR